MRKGWIFAATVACAVCVASLPPAVAQVAEADLAISKDDGCTSIVPGMPVTYTITVTNHGPSDTQATVMDTFPATLSGIVWTATFGGGGTGGSTGSGNLSELVFLPAGGFGTYTVTALVAPTATGVLSNTATVTADGGVFDANPGNNASTDTDMLTPQVDLAVSKTDGASTYVPGRPITYTITVVNHGPSFLSGGVVTDIMSPDLSAVTWTAAYTGIGSAGPASGSGDVAATIDLAVGGTATLTVSGTIRPAAAYALTNAVTVVPGAGITETNLENNTAVDTDSMEERVADIRVSKTDGVATYTPGGSLRYTVIVENLGPSVAPHVRVLDAMPASMEGASWTAVFSGGAGAASGSGSIDETIDLEAGGSATYTIAAKAASGASGDISNSVTVSVPPGVSDPDLANNTAVDVDTMPPARASAAVHRFYNRVRGAHFYTASAAEYDYVRATWPGIFEYEGIAFHAVSGPASVPLYRFYNRVDGAHFYTISTAERDWVLMMWRNVFTSEGIACSMLGTSTDGACAVHRFYNRLTKAHFYTASEDERQSVLVRYPQFEYEGVAFYAMP